MLDGIKAILFDLDGTLLDLDMDVFLPAYLRAVGTCAPHIVDPRVLAKELMKASDMMIQNDDFNKTNMDAFASHFYPGLGVTEDALRPHLEEFYENSFGSLKALSKRIDSAREVVEAAKDEGYLLVLATNPVFPRTAIMQRIQWAGIDPQLFELITTYEDMHACKPQVKYFLEIADIIGCSPKECLMVGNDVQEDIIAGSIGMKTFLVDTRQIDRGIESVPPDYLGNLEDLKVLITAGA